mmetsp:Transcript_13222/g.28077  ORF Transcript_13222/g.28077 Transcript_13222/m.28077 type:complete len:84 (-) Transcript_13222:290-541(-)
MESVPQERALHTEIRDTVNMNESNLSPIPSYFAFYQMKTKANDWGHHFQNRLILIAKTKNCYLEKTKTQENQAIRSCVFPIHQ